MHTYYSVDESWLQMLKERKNQSFLRKRF